MLQLLPVSVPRDIVPDLNSSTVLPVSAVPLNVGVSSLVTLSVLELPVSEEAVMSGVDGEDGAMVSMVTLRDDEAELVLPAASVAFAVML